MFDSTDGPRTTDTIKVKGWIIKKLQLLMNKLTFAGNACLIHETVITHLEVVEKSNRHGPISKQIKLNQLKLS